MLTAPMDGDPREGLTELRHLIVGPEQRQLRHLQERLDHFAVQPDDVG